MSFAPCPSCARHVKTTDAACPFCKTELPNERDVLPVRSVLGLSRAAAYAISASIAVAGCSAGSLVVGADGGDGGSSSGDPDGGKSDAKADTGPTDDGGIQPPYGAPAYGAPPYGAPPYGAPAYGAVPTDSGSD